MPTINDVAKMAGVSTATVSRTFRTPSLLTEETQQRVLEAARKLNYHPRGIRTRGRHGENRQPSPTESRPQEAIGFQFFADRPTDTLQSNTFYSPLLMGAQQEAAALGLNLLIHTTNRHQLAKKTPKMVEERAIAGMLLVGAADDPETVALFAGKVPHIILVDDIDLSGKFECVTSDCFGGAREATRYLIELGHRKIAFYLAEEQVRTFRNRMHGYIAALFDAGIIPNPALVISDTVLGEQREAKLAALFSRPDRPTALLAANDEYALGAMQTLRRLGLRVPEDVSLVGFDDIAFSTLSDPPLTTVRVDTESMGRLAVRRLHTRIHAGDAVHSVRNEVPVSLVVRHSCRSLQDH